MNFGSDFRNRRVYQFTDHGDLLWHSFVRQNVRKIGLKKQKKKNIAMSLECISFFSVRSVTAVAASVGRETRRGRNILLRRKNKTRY